MSRSLRLLASLLVILTIAPCAAYAQQWNGSTSATGSINRTGPVGVGISNPAHPLDVAGIIQADSLLLKGQVGVALSPSLQSLYLGTMSPSATGGQNTFVGFGVAPLNTTGNENTAVGYWTLRDNTTGRQNVAIGKEALRKNTTGSSNVAIGKGALYSNTEGIQNTAVGFHTLLSNTTGSYNTALGTFALLLNTTGSSNTAVGRFALQTNATGSGNTAFGPYALYSNTSGSANMAFGGNALEKNTTGGNNIALGSSALKNNSTGGTNVAIGTSALSLGTSGLRNIAIGTYGLLNNNGTDNIGLGYQAGYGLTSGNENTLIGSYAGNDLTTGSRNIIIGHNQDAPTPTTSNHLNIGGLLYGNLSTGRIGIGKDTPGYALDVSGIINADSILVNGQPLVAGSGASDTTGTWALSNGDAYFTSGNVGIGTTTPSNKLHLNGSDNYIRFTDTDATTGARIGLNGLQLFLDNQEASDIVFRTSAVEAMRINRDGEVGIGVSDPQSKLVVTDTGTSGRIISVKSTSSSGGAALSLVNDTGKEYQVQAVGSGIAGDRAGDFEIRDTGTGAVRLTVDTGGNVGIGTTSPGYALDVAGTINADSLLVNGQPFSGGGAWASSNEDLYYSAGHVGIGAADPSSFNQNGWTGQLVVAGGSGNGGIVIQGSSASTLTALRFGTAGSSVNTDKGFINYDLANDKMTLGTNREGRVAINSAGNVGIGTTNPQSTLEAAHSGEAQITISFDNDNDYSAIANSGIVFKNNGITQVGQLIYNEANSGRLSLGIGSSESITIRSDENVGIGTTDPQSKLAVNGTITSKEVIVTDTPGEWPDFVFDEDYELRSLQEVQSFIEQHGHLPEVPSAAEVEANGVAVGAMQATLLQKIEELTLYLLEQQRQNAELQKTVTVLQEQVSSLKKTVGSQSGEH